ncbi:30S ribosomal protein S12 methylthiotransferase RimO [bacterium]|nr:30S ribosomal protein S12 methylthiotransferase RimO [bacterium]
MSDSAVKFSVVSLGCARTLVDTEKMVHSLQTGGFGLTAEGSGEQITILNTCSFIQSAIDETEANIEALSERKRDGGLQYLVVSGCYPSRFKKPDLQARYPDVDLWLTTKEEDKVQQELTALVFKHRFQPNRPVRYTKLTPSHFSYIKISEGCDNWCSFCTIPKIRGTHTSRTIEEVVKEAQLQVSFGARELVLIAEDTTAWGEDLYGKPSLPLLLNELAKVKGVEWIRLMYIFPPRVNDELIQTIKSTPNIIPYLDMPVQHSNTRLLALMNRKYTGDFLRGIIREMNQEIPELVLRTSLILGFPTETESEFNELMDFIEEYPFAHLGCFSYSEERETRSARLEPKIAPDIIQSRIRTIMDHQLKLVRSRNKSLVGTTLDMVYEGDRTGRSYREAPDVDGKLLVVDAGQLKGGQMAKVKVIGVSGHDLTVSVIKR